MNTKPQQWDAIILGAGISGLVAAKLLQKQGVAKIAIIEEYNHVGGNHIDRHIGPFTFDLGALIFYEDSPFFGHFPELLPLYVPIEATVGRIIPSGETSFYPISIRTEVFGKSFPELAKLVSSLVISRLFHSKPTNAAEFARFWIGDRLFDKSGLGNYMERFYGVRADEIELDFAKKRMQWISDAASLRKRLRGAFKSKAARKKVQPFVRPRAGFSTLYDLARGSLEERGTTFFLGETVVSIEKVDKGFCVHSEHDTWQTSRLISTIPLQRVPSLCGMDDTPKLATVELLSLFFSFKGDRGFPYSILYNFSSAGRWKRLTMFSDFYGFADGRQYFGVEVNLPLSSEVSFNELVQDFTANVRDRALFDGELRLEGFLTTPNAYPVYTGGATEEAQRLLRKVHDYGIESVGRQGGFDYLPSAANVTAVVETALSDKRRSMN